MQEPVLFTSPEVAQPSKVSAWARSMGSQAIKMTMANAKPIRKCLIDPPGKRVTMDTIYTHCTGMCAKLGL